MTLDRYLEIVNGTFSVNPGLASGFWATVKDSAGRVRADCFGVTPQAAREKAEDVIASRPEVV